MALVLQAEPPSEKGSVAQLAQILEKADNPMTIGDVLMELGVVDPARQRSLSAAFFKECYAGGKYAHLIGRKVRPSTAARGRVSRVFDGVDPIPPRTELIKRSDAFQGIRAIDRRNLSAELRGELDRVTGLNLTGRSGEAVNQLAVAYDHALDLEKVKVASLTQIAEERRQMNEQLMDVINRLTGDSEPDGPDARRRLRPGTMPDAAE